MIPLPLDATTPDVDQWCSRGVIMYTPESGPPVPGWYLGCTGRRVISFAELPNFPSRGVPLERVSVHWPICGSVNLPALGYAVHAARKPLRQYRRTWHAAGLAVTTPRVWDVARFHRADASSMTVPAKELAAACFFPTYPTYDSADRQLQMEQAVSVALSPHIILAGDATGKRMFYYNGELAATAAGAFLHPVGSEVAVRKIIKLVEGRFNVTTNN